MEPEKGPTCQWMANLASNAMIQLGQFQSASKIKMKNSCVLPEDYDESYFQESEPLFEFDNNGY